MLARAAVAEKDHDKRVQDLEVGPKGCQPREGLAAAAALSGAGAAFATALLALRC